MYLFFHTTPTPQIYTLSLHDALPILSRRRRPGDAARPSGHPGGPAPAAGAGRARRLAAELDRRLQLAQDRRDRSEEHTSELQSRQYLVCRLLLEKKKNEKQHNEHMN